MYINIRSEVRRKAVRRVLEDVLKYSKKNLSEDTLQQIVKAISLYEVERGVCVFMSAKKPEGYDVRFIGKIDTGKEYLYLWWTDNENDKNPSKAYALAMTFKYKSGNDVAIYTEEDWKRDYSAFDDYYPELRGNTWKVRVFMKFSEFYKKVIDIPGEWLLQDPTMINRDLSAPMGKLASDNRLYIYQPNIKTKRDYFNKLIKII